MCKRSLIMPAWGDNASKSPHCKADKWAKQRMNMTLEWRTAHMLLERRLGPVESVKLLLVSLMVWISTHEAGNLSQTFHTVSYRVGQSHLSTSELLISRSIRWTSPDLMQLLYQLIDSEGRLVSQWFDWWLQVDQSSTWSCCTLLSKSTHRPYM